MKKTLAASILLIATAAAASASEAPAAIDAAAALEKAPVVAPAAPIKVSDDRSGFGINAGVTTLGTTFEPVWRVNNRFGLRMPIGNGSFSYDEESDGETYEADLEIGGVGLVADFYPTGKNFHLSAGAFKTNYSADLSGSNIDLDGFGTAEIDVKVRQKRDVSPFLGLGYDGRIGKHGTISFGAGAIFGGGFDIEARESTGLASQSDVDNEIADISDTLADLNVIPYAKLMIGFRF